MALKKITFKDTEELKDHLKSHSPTFYYGSQTSTVIPYDKLEEIYKDEDFYLGNLSQLPSSMDLTADKTLQIKGPVNWKDAKAFLKSKGRNIMTAPTENLALITAGAATSATGERCFHFGNLRSQIKKIKYLNYKGEEKTLNADKPINTEFDLSDYQKEFEKYSNLKNAPFPRFETETDLLIGTEGQLGVITEIEIDTCEDMPVNHLFMLLPKWEEDYSAHMEVSEKIQNFREDVILCEFIDSNSFSFLKTQDRPNQGKDALFFEIKSEAFEKFYEQFLLDLSFLNEEEVFELSENRFHEIRASIPRAVFEENSKMGVVKMGTDVQVPNQYFSKLLDIYKDFSKTGVRYNLFGHFGDAHLHFNFMPTPADTESCSNEFQNMYQTVKDLNASPFAEHGIGIIKQKFIANYWNDDIYSIFKKLKETYDPHSQFFPQGFMNLKKPE